MVNAVTSLQQGPLLKSTACPGVSVWSSFFHVCVGSLWVTWFPPTIQRHAGIGGRLIGYSKLPKGVIVSTVTDWFPLLVSIPGFLLTLFMRSSVFKTLPCNYRQ